MIDTLLTRAEILGVQPGSGVDAIGIAKGLLVAIDSTAALCRNAGPSTQHIDLGGRAVLPAFADPHIHLWKVGQLKSAVADLRGSKSLLDLRQRLESRAADRGAGQWLVGRGVNERLLSERCLPDRKLLDSWFGDRPVLVTRVCAHVAVANSAALRIAGVSADTPDPAGGEILRDTQGEPTGIVTETAVALMNSFVPAPTDADYRRWIAAAVKRKLAQGCASATDPGVDDRLIGVYRSMEAADELPLRCHVMRLAPESGPISPSQIESPESSGHLSIDTVKFFLDGGLSGATAAISREYRQGGYGVLRMSGAEFANRLKPYVQAGYSVAVHAIGDVAIDAALDAFSVSREWQKRFRIEHLGLPTAASLERAAKLGVMVATQPAFLPELGPNFEAYLPQGFPITPYPFRSMLEAGMTVAFSSDAPVVVDDSPLGGIAAAVRRLGEGDAELRERLSVIEAVRAYTLGAAEIEGVATHRGSIEVGKAADLVVLNRNPLTTPIEEFDSIKVDTTYVGGKPVYQR